MSSADGLTTPLLSTIGSPHLGRPRAGAFLSAQAEHADRRAFIVRKWGMPEWQGAALESDPKRKSPNRAGSGLSHNARYAEPVAQFNIRRAALLKG